MRPSPARFTTLRFQATAGSSQVGACLAAAHVTAEAGAHEALAHEWLQAGELTRYRRFLVDSARRDFLAGRIAAKSALQALAPAAHAGRDWEIVSGTWQHPSVRGPAAGLAITLAHADGTGVAIACDDRWVAGIDIEPAHRVASETIASQVSAQEADWARAPAGSGSTDGEYIRWLALWTGREAFGKLLGTGLGLPEALLPLTNWKNAPCGWIAGLAGNDSFAIRTIATATSVVSLAVPAGSSSPQDEDDLARWLAHALQT